MNKFKIQIIDEYPEVTCRSFELYSKGFFAKSYSLDKVTDDRGNVSVRLTVDDYTEIENCNCCRILVDGIEIYSSKTDYEKLTHNK